MSLEAIRWATSPAAKSTGAQRALLCILADKANKEHGHACWPSDEMLAEALHCSVRTIWRHIGELRACGDIAVESGGGRSKRNIYTFPALCETGNPANSGREYEPETLTNGAETLTTDALNPDNLGAKPCQTARINPDTIVSPIKQPFLKATELQPEQKQPQPPPPLRDADDDGGGGLAFDDEELETLLEELQKITGRPPVNYERSVLAISEFRPFRRRALRELRRDRVTVKSKNNTGWWLKSVIERLIDEQVRAKAPLFPIDDDAAAEHRRKYVRDDDEEFALIYELDESA